MDLSIFIQCHWADCSGRHWKARGRLRCCTTGSTSRSGATCVAPPPWLRKTLSFPILTGAASARLRPVHTYVIRLQLCQSGTVQLCCRTELRRRRRPQLFDHPHPQRLPHTQWIVRSDASADSGTADAEQSSGDGAALEQQQAEDLRAVGRIAVQLCQGRCLHFGSRNSAAWDAQVSLVGMLPLKCYVPVLPSGWRK